MVHAAELSERAILDAIRAGHVFVDVEGTTDRMLELNGRCGRASAIMGDALTAPSGAEASFEVRVQNLKGARVDIVMDGEHGVALADAFIERDDQTFEFSLPGDGARHWLRADVRSADGDALLMIGNPIYLNL